MTSFFKKTLKDQIDGQNDEYKEVIIENESQKFIEIFDKILSKESDETNDEIDALDALDATDGLVDDIISAIISKIKAIIKQKFVKEVIQENGEDESSSETET